MLFTSPAVHASPGPYQDNVLYVDNDWCGGSGVPSQLSYGDNAFASIGKAVDSASQENNIIKVFPGVYSDSLESFPIISSIENLKISSVEGPKNTILRGTEKEDIIHVTKKNVNIRGFQLENGLNGIVIEGTENAIVENNISINNSGIGFVIKGSSNCFFSKNISKNNLFGFNLMFVGTDNNVLINNRSENNRDGFGCFNGENNTIENNLFLNNERCGLGLGNSDNNKILRNTMKKNNTYGLKIINDSSNSVLENNSVDNNTMGILLEKTENTIMENNSLNNNAYNFGVQRGRNLEINDSNTVNGEPIVYLRDKSNIKINKENSFGYLGFENCSNIIIENLRPKDFEKNIQGILISQNSRNITIENCLIEKNWLGIRVDASSDLKMENNSLKNNKYSLKILGDSTHNIDKTNKVNGEQVLYLKNENNFTINEDNTVGYLGLVSCENVKIENIDLENQGQGIIISNGENVNVENIVINNCLTGVYLDTSHFCEVSNSIIENTGDVGISLNGDSDNNIVANNRLDNNHSSFTKSPSIRIFKCDNNRVENNITQNEKYVAPTNVSGISLYESDNNIIENNISTEMRLWGNKNSENNLVINNQGGSIVLASGSKNNEVRKNVENIVRLGGSNNTIENNTCKGEVGLFVGGKSNTIENNFICSRIIGILIFKTQKNNTISKNTIKNSYRGIEFLKADNQNIENNDIENCHFSIYLKGDSENNKISLNTIRKNESGIIKTPYKNLDLLLDNVNSLGSIPKQIYTFWPPDGTIPSGNEIINNSIENNSSFGIVNNCPAWKNVSNNTFVNNGTGIKIRDANGGIVENNLIENNRLGLILENSHNIKLENNSLENNRYNLGVRNGYNHQIDNSNTVNGKPVLYFRDRNDLTISQENEFGYLAFVNCSNVLVENLGYNEFENNLQGMLLENTKDSNIENVSVENNKVGVLLKDSDNISMEKSSMKNNIYNFSVENGYNHQISKTNKVNNKPIHYLQSENNIVLNQENTLSYLGIVNCENVIVENLNLENNGQGILIVKSENVRTENLELTNNKTGLKIFKTVKYSKLNNCKIKNNQNGVLIENSRNYSIQNSHIKNSREKGFRITNSEKISLENNFIENNGTTGVLFKKSQNSKIILNTIQENTTSGIKLLESSNNRISKNELRNIGKGIELLGLENTENNLVENNLILNIEEVGILLKDNSSQNIITKNTVGESKYGFKLGENTKNNTLFHNFAYSNKESNATDYGNNTWENEELAEGNWWGDWQPPETTSDSNGDGVLDDPYSFKFNQDSHPLALVTLQSPSDDASPSDSTPTLKWSTPVLPEYKVQIFTDDGFSSVEEESGWIRKEDYTTSSLSDGTYYWRVKGKTDDPYQTSWTNSRSFTISTEEEEEPTPEPTPTPEPAPTNESPTADFTHLPLAPTIGDTIDFSDQSSDPDGSIVSWSWDFGDGATSGSQNPSHSYDTADNYTVSLTVTDDNGATDAFSKIIEVVSSATVNQPPTADAGGSYSVNEEGTVELDGTGSNDPDGSILNYSWSITSDSTGESSLSDSTTATPVFIAPSVDENRQVTVTLTVTDENDDADNDPVSIMVKALSEAPSPEEVENMTPENAVENLASSDPTTVAETLENVAPGITGDIIDSAVESGRMEEFANVYRRMSSSAASKSLLRATPANSASVLESMISNHPDEAGEIVDEGAKSNLSKTVSILEGMEAEPLATLLIKVYDQPETPQVAADLLGATSSEKSVATVQNMVGREKYSYIDGMFKQLSDDSLKTIWNGLTEPQQDELQPHLSEGVKESLGIGAGGFPWTVVSVAFVLIVILIIGILYRTRSPESSGM